MSAYEELDKLTTLADQMDANEGPIVLLNVFTIDPEDEADLLKSWASDASFLKKQPGYISTQLHKGLAGSGTYVNYAIWESTETFKAAFTQPEFQKYFDDYPDSAIARPHLFRKLAIANHCTA